MLSFDRVTSSPSMTLTYLLFFIAPTLKSPLLFSLLPRKVLQNLGSNHLPILLTVPLSPQRTSPFLEFSESSSGCLCFLLLLSLSFCRGILVSSSFPCCCSFYFSDTECPPYNLVLSTDGSVSFPFGKDGSGVLSNYSLYGTEATLFFSAAPVCSSISAEACAILYALCWSRQHQQVCHFSPPI